MPCGRSASGSTGCRSALSMCASSSAAHETLRGDRFAGLRRGPGLRILSVGVAQEGPASAGHPFHVHWRVVSAAAECIDPCPELWPRRETALIDRMRLAPDVPGFRVQPARLGEVPLRSDLLAAPEQMLAETEMQMRHGDVLVRQLETRRRLFRIEHVLARPVIDDPIAHGLVVR